MTTTIGTPTLAAINQRNAQFWAGQMELVEQRVADERLFRMAMNDLASEQARDVPVYSRKTFEAAVEAAANAKAVFQGESCRKGGMASKSDPLTRLIEQLVQQNLEISERQFWHALKKEVGKGVIISIDSEPSKPNSGAKRKIHFVAKDGKVKTAPVSGLKHRLSRARKKISVSLGG